jgi:hypothetical protein
MTSASSDSPSMLNSLDTICRAGAVVLLVGFWFDGGLFKLSVAPVFWALLELSSWQRLRQPSLDFRAKRSPNAG